MREKIQVRDRVLVYDRHRFGIPLKAVVNDFSICNDGVRVRLLESNNAGYPIGCENVWVHVVQLRLVEKQPDPGPGGIGID